MTDCHDDAHSGGVHTLEEPAGGSAVAGKPQPAAVDPVWKERILVADDEERVCQTLEEFLTLRGYLVDAASGGPEAIKLLEENVYALLLTDLMMPRMNGLELMEQARELDPDLMVVIITGFGTIETAVQALKQGAYDYVLKPFSLMEIERTVERALEKRRLTHENLQLAEVNRKLREIDALKSDLLGIVSHEFRTPLTSLKGYVSLLRSCGLGPLAEPQVEALEAVDENTRRLEKLVDNILVLAEVGAGGAEIRMQDVNLGAALERAVQQCASEIASAGLDIRVQIEGELPPVRGDFDKLVMAFANLVENAVKFRSESPEIEARVVPNSHRGAGWVDVVIADNGIGISEQDLSTIFGHFVQVDMSATRRVGGVGLGLSVVKEIINSHGGSVTVQSRLGAGTTVTVSLPTRTVS